MNNLMPFMGASRGTGVTRLLFVLLILSVAESPASQESSVPTNAATLAVSVARITAKKIDRARNEFYTEIGTGFVWNHADQIVTAYHVVSGAIGIEVKFLKTDETFEGRDIKVIRVLKKADLALLEIPGKGGRPLRLGSPRRLQGEDLTVIGYPMGMYSVFGRHVRSPVVSEDTLWPLLNEEMRDKLFGSGGELDAHMPIVPLETGLLPGDSGAPIFDSRGDVVAIGHGGYFVMGAASINWAIPASRLTELLQSNERADEKIDSRKFWYGWTVGAAKQENDRMQGEGTSKDLGARLRAPLLDLAASSNFGLPDGVSVAELALFGRVYPLPNKVPPDDRFIVGLRLALLYAEDRTSFFALPTFRIDDVSRKNLCFLIGPIASYFLIPNRLYLSAAVSYAIPTTRFFGMEFQEQSFPLPVSFQTSVGFDFLHGGLFKLGTELKLLYAPRDSQRFEFDYFGNADIVHETSHEARVFLGLVVGFNDEE